MEEAPFKVLGFDFGLKYIGVAVGQSITQSATPLPAIYYKNEIQLRTAIDPLVLQWKPKHLILGWPLHMDGSVQPFTEEVERFGHFLSDTYQLPLSLVDERLTTWEAKKQMREQKGGKPSLHHAPTQAFIRQINSMAAATLVRSWWQTLG